MKKQLQKTLVCLFYFVLLSFSTESIAQNVFSGEPVQVVGQMNGYGTTTAANSTFRRVSVASGNPTDGRGQWTKTYNAQASGGDVLNSNMPGGGGNGFLFISGPSGNRFQNKWVFSGVGQAGLNSINSGLTYNSGNDMGLNMSTAGRYTFVFNDVGYTATNAKFYVGYTANDPVTVARTSQNALVSGATVSITTSGTPSSGENVYLRYRVGTNDFTASTAVVQATGSGTSWTATLPSQSCGTTVYYYVYTSTRTLSQINADSETDRSLATLRYDDSFGANFSMTFTSPTAPTGSLAIANSTCASACTVSGGSIAIGTVSGSGGTLEYSLNGGTSWSSTLPTYAAPQTIIASILSTNGCRSTTLSAGSTVAGVCTTPSAPTGSLAITNSTCASACTVSGGSIAIGTVSGSGGTIEYSLNGGTSWSSTLPTYAAPQTIIASVINGSGCRSTSTSVGSTVAGVCTTPSAPTGSLAITNSTCASACTVSGGSIAIGTVSGSGGTIEYSLNGGTSWSSTLPTYAAPQTIIASVINASGCRSTNTSVGSTVAGVCAPVTPGITNNNGLALTCAIPNTTLTASGGVSYSWSNGATTASTTVTTAGTFTVTVTGANGCTATANVTTTLNNTPPTVTAANVSGCSGTAVTLSGLPAGGSYSIANPYTGASTTYTYSYTNPANGCSATSSAATVTTASCQPAQLANCGNTPVLTSVNSRIFVANTVTQATKYRFRVAVSTAPTTYFYAETTYPSFRLTDVVGLTPTYGTTYNVEIQNEFLIGGNPATSVYGAMCTVTTLTVTNITIQTNQCNQTLAAINSKIYVNGVPGATMYSYRIAKQSAPTTYSYIDTPYSNFRLTAPVTSGTVAIEHNTVYLVSVSVITANGASNYNGECQIGTPAGPTTTLQGSQCGDDDTPYQIATKSTKVYAADLVSGATYTFKLEQYTGDTLVATKYATSPINYFNCNMFTGDNSLLPNTNYHVYVSINYYGAGEYDHDCVIKTPAALKQVEMTQEFKAVAYPNPFANNFMIDVKSESQSTINVKVYDMIGRMIDQKDVRISDLETTTIGDNYPSGVYNVVVSQESSVEAVRVVKR